MITTEKQDIRTEIKNAVSMSIDIANAYYGTNYPDIESRFDLKGGCAGQFVMKGGKDYFRFNLILATENWNHFLKVTVPHEVAHYIQRKKFGHYDAYGRRVPPHGKQWKSIMKNCFGLRPHRCHSYDTSNARRSTRKVFEYKCKCRTFQFTSVRHNKVKRGVVYTCQKCHTACRPA